MTKEDERVELKPLDFANQYMRNNYGKLLEADPDEYHLRLGMLGDALTDFHALNSRISPDPERIREEAIRECARVADRIAKAAVGVAHLPGNSKHYTEKFEEVARQHLQTAAAIRSLLTTKPAESEGK